MEVFMEKIIFKTKIDFKELAKYRDPNKDDLPVIGFISLYRAIGLLDAAEKYKAEHPDFFIDITNKSNIVCNFSTQRRLQTFIEDIWKTYSIDIDANEHVFWDTSKFPKGKKHYAKKLKAAARNAVRVDFGMYCPGLDDELGVNEIVLKVYEPDEQSEDNSEEKGAQA